MKRIRLFIPLAIFAILYSRVVIATEYNDVALSTGTSEQKTNYSQLLAASSAQDIPKQAPITSGKLSKPASKSLIIPVPSVKDSDAIVVPRENCGTAWTEWVDDPEADMNPCPKACERGERQVLDQHKSGNTTQYKARYQCYLPELVVKQPPWALKRLKEDGKPRSNCGTAWTKRSNDPNADVNPCPSNCERGELQIVNRNRSGDTLQYEMRYQCYVTELSSSKSAGIKASTSSTGQAGATTTVQPVSGAPKGAQVAGTDTTSTSSGIEGVSGMKQIEMPAAAGRPLSTANIEGPGTTITYLNNIGNVFDGRIYLHWTATAGASSYIIHAHATDIKHDVSDEVTGPPNHPQDNEYAKTLSGVAPETKYSVWVDVKYPDGRVGTSDRQTITTFAAGNPGGLTVSSIGPGAVKLEWQPSRGAEYYVVEGSNLPRMQTVNTAVAVTELPPGTHEWTVISYYAAGLHNDLNPSRVSTTIESGADVQSKGHYRITINGFRVNVATNDDPLQLDGKGDEVYITAIVDKYDRVNRQILRHDEVESPVFGDKNGFPQSSRVMAGSLSEAGGLRSGDSYPSATPAIKTRGPYLDDLPLQVWDGELESGKDVLIVMPVLWEWSNDRYQYTFWLDRVQKKIQANDFITNNRINAQFLASQIPVLRGGLAEIIIHDGDTRDQPVGTIPDPKVNTMRDHDVDVIVLTRENIENELSAQDSTSGLSPGTISLSFRDTGSSSKGGDYTLYLQVERVP